MSNARGPLLALYINQKELYDFNMEPVPVQQQNALEQLDTSRYQNDLESKWKVHVHFPSYGICLIQRKDSQILNY